MAAEILDGVPASIQVCDFEWVERMLVAVKVCDVQWKAG